MFEGGIIVRKILVVILAAILVFAMTPVAFASSSQNDPKALLEQIKAIQTRLDLIQGKQDGLGTYAGLLSIEKEIIASSALTIGVGGPIRPSMPLVGRQVYGGDLVRDEYHLISYRRGMTLVNLVSDSNLESIEVAIGGRFIWMRGNGDGVNSIISFYLPSQEDAKITLIYRAPSAIGKYVFLTAVYDGGEVDEKG